MLKNVECYGCARANRKMFFYGVQCSTTYTIQNFTSKKFDSKLNLMAFQTDWQIAGTLTESGFVRYRGPCLSFCRIQYSTTYTINFFTSKNFTSKNLIVFSTSFFIIYIYYIL